jgi:tetratricopeptide (TPR) repeat protein
MAPVSLSDSQACITFWRRCVLSNLHYWQTYLERHTGEVVALEQEWEAIIKAISLGLKLKEGWPQVYPLIVNFSDFMERRGYWSTWQTVLNQALELARQTSNDANQVTLSVLSARLRQRQGDFEQMVSLSRRLGDLFNEGRACTNLGFYFIERGHWRRAEVLCCHALGIFEEIGSDHGRAHTENHLGVLYDCQRRWEKALYHYKQAYHLWQGMNDAHGLMRGSINLGLLLVNMDQTAKALDYLNQAIELAEQTGEVAEICAIYVNMALAHYRQGALGQAEEYAGKAVILSQRHNNSLMLAQAWRYLGLACLHQGRQPEAEQYLRAALELVRSLKVPFRAVEILLDVVECSLMAGDTSQAASWLGEAEELADREELSQPMQSLLLKARQRLEVT